MSDGNEEAFERAGLITRDQLPPLQPCPFCGIETPRQINTAMVRAFTVLCICGARMDGANALDAAERWNRRS